MEVGFVRFALLIFFWIYLQWASLEYESVSIFDKLHDTEQKTRTFE